MATPSDAWEITEIREEGAEFDIDRALWTLLKHLPRGTLERMHSRAVASLLLELAPAEMEGATVRDIRRRWQTVLKYRARLERLLAKPQVPQRSDAWYRLRQERLTASDLAQALGKGKFGNRDDLLRRKIKERGGEAADFNMTAPPLKWGTMFEDMAARMYSERHNDITLHEFGLLPHPELACFGASPDAITDMGVMVEFKCPYRRAITGEIPEQYMLQMQGQLAVCGLGECDYVECQILNYESKQANPEPYLAAVAEGAVHDHGIIVEFARDGRFVYAYSPAKLTPAQAVRWAQDELRARLQADAGLEFTKYHYWRLQMIHITRVRFDAEGWEALVPRIEEFWEHVQQGRLPPEKVKRPRKAPGGSSLQETTALDFLPDDDSGDEAAS